MATRKMTWVITGDAKALAEALKNAKKEGE
jgi:hypothetical protein